MTLAFLFILGLTVGSFLNVVIFRLEADESPLFGRSRCNVCRRTIRWYDNVPVLSYLILGGRCRDCGERISLQYPAVELGTAVLFSAAGYRFFDPSALSTSVETVFVVGLIAVLTVIFVFDLRHMEIPVSALRFAILWSGIGLGVLYFVDPGLSSGFWDSRFGEGVIGGAVAYAIFFGLVAFSKETWMGWGDVWLALILGFVVGWQLLLPALTLAFGSGAVVGLGLIASGRKGMKSRIPFGPFLAGATVAMIFFGEAVARRLFVFGW